MRVTNGSLAKGGQRFRFTVTIPPFTVEMGREGFCPDDPDIAFLKDADAAAYIMETVPRYYDDDRGVSSSIIELWGLLEADEYADALCGAAVDITVTGGINEQ